MLGRHVARELEARRYPVRRLTRHAPAAAPGTVVADLRNPASLRGSCDGVRTVISCAGASMRLDNWGDRASFDEVDWSGNQHLLAEALQSSSVRKFIYVSLAHGPRFIDTAYGRAHERFVAELARSGLEYSVIRPTGFFGFLLQILKMAEKGRAAIAGDGQARTNPIHEADVARACVDAITGSQPDLPVGGPEIFTRLEVAELAFRVAGKKQKITSIPPWAGSLIGRIAGLMNPRMGALFVFGAAVSQVDVLAPAYGFRKLEDYFRAGGQGIPEYGNSVPHSKI